MGRSYFDETAKMYHSPFPKWSMDACMSMHNVLLEKGYSVSCVYRVGCDRRYHDAWLVKRADIPRLVEQLFRQRIVVEVQAEGHGKASINFVYDYSEAQICDAVERFWKNNNPDTFVEPPPEYWENNDDEED